MRNLFGYLKGDDSLEEFFADFPGVKLEQVDAVMPVWAEGSQDSLSVHFPKH